MFEAEFVSGTFWSSKPPDLIEEENFQTALEAHSRQDRARAQSGKVSRYAIPPIYYC